jgi:predicted lipoprotein
MTRPVCRRIVLKLAAVALFAPAAANLAAQSSRPDVAVPFYKPEDVITGLYQHWAQPRAAVFADTAKQMHLALATFCGDAPGRSATSIREARSAWKAAVAGWERLSAVPFGPLIERRSVRAIDFTPTRPPLIERAIKQAPRGAAAMERIGSPAKGFPALEWLLWEKPIDRGTQACAYAVEAAADITREADALKAAFANANPGDWDAEQTAAAFTEFVNQWVGSMERLRWQEIERPVREAKSTSRSAARFPRQLSGATSGSWSAHWESLRDLAVSGEQEAPQPREALIPMESYLRGRGHAALAQRWQEAFRQGGAAMQGLAPNTQSRLLPTAKRLATIKRMAEDEVAPALNVSIGFSDADGD